MATAKQVKAAQDAAAKLNKERGEAVEREGRTGDGSYGPDGQYAGPVLDVPKGKG